MLSYGGDGSGVKGKVNTQLCCGCHSLTESTTLPAVASCPLEPSLNSEF